MKLKLFQHSSSGQIKEIVYEEIYQMEINDCLEVGGGNISDIVITTTKGTENEFFRFRDKLDIDIQSDNKVTIQRIPLEEL